MRHLSIDIETYSSVDIGSAGLYKYVESSDFQILLFAYSIDGAEPEIVDLAEGEKIPEAIVHAMADPAVIKHAFNAAFEIACLSRFYHIIPAQWQCTMVHTYYLRFTGGLDAVGKALGFKEDRAKDRSGKALIRYFCSPCPPTKSNSGRTRNLPYHDPEKWANFKEYCKQDVVAETAILERLSPWPMPDHEWDLWHLDQEINRRGVRIDTALVDGAIAFDEISQEYLISRAKEITGLSNPNSVTQLKGWIEEETGEEIKNLNKEAVKTLIKECSCEKIKEVLAIRQQLGKSSVSKYTAMANAVCADERVRGLLQFYGAGTGRWAGRLVQVQNLPRNSMDLGMLDLARILVKERKFEALEVVFGNVQDTLSQLIRTAFIPAEGHYFAISDFSAIEARVIAWLAKESWRQEVFATTGKIYEASAAQMFGVPVETIAPGKENYHLRQKGKVAELALGYQGSTGALIQMGALKMGIPEEELPTIVQLWRDRSPRIRDLWYALESAALEAVSSGQPQVDHGLTFRLERSRQDSYLTIELPSGRKLFYRSPILGENQWGSPQISFLVNDRMGSRKEPTYGGKLTENVVQAIARDCLAVSLLRLKRAGFRTVMHIHDEVVLEVPDENPDALKTACDIMAQPIDWAPGLILKGAGFTAQYYMKD